jgi:hypothetical protein
MFEIAKRADEIRATRSVVVDAAVVGVSEKVGD